MEYADIEQFEQSQAAMATASTTNSVDSQIEIFVQNVLVNEIR